MTVFNTVHMGTDLWELTRMDRQGRPTGHVVSVTTSMADERRVPGVEVHATPDGSQTEVVVDGDLSADLICHVLALLHGSEIELRSLLF